MNHRDGDPTVIQLVRVHRHTILWPGNHLPPAPEDQEAGLHLPHLLFEARSVAGEAPSLKRKHVRAVIDLQSPSPRIIMMTDKLVVAGDVDVVSGTVLIDERLAL